jgi:hypothetical protein
MAGLGAASYKLALDAGDIKAGAATAQSSFRAMNSTFRSLESPLEKLQRRLAAAEKGQDDFIEGTESWKRAASNISKLNDEIGKLRIERISELGESIRNTSLKIGAAAGAITAGMVLVGRDMVNAFAEAEASEVKLSAAMTGAGTNSDTTMESYKAFAGQMMRLTTVDDDAVLGMLQMAESMGVSGAAAERAAKNAIGLGSALGVDTQVAMKMSVALEQGNTTLLTRYLPSLKGVKNESEKAALAQQLLDRMFATARAETQTYAGSTKQLSNELGNLKEDFGKIISDGLSPFVQQARQMVASVSGMSDGTKELIAYTGIAVTGLGSFVTTGASVAATAGQIAMGYAALQKTAAGAKVAQLALNSAVGVGYAAAAAAAVAAGYMLGRHLESQTEQGQRFAKVLGGIRDSIASVGTVDTSEVSTASLDKYIASTEKQIEKTKEHNAQLQAQQGWTNAWQKNKLLIDENNKSLDQMNANLAAAKLQRAKQVEPTQGDKSEAIDKKAEAAAKRDEERQERSVEHANKSAADKIAAMELEKEMWGKTAKEIAREREAREMERAGVNKYLIDLFRERSAELDTLETKKRAADEAAKEARENARKQAAEDKRMADEAQRRRDQLFKAARQAVSGADPETEYRENLKQFTEWLKAKAITIDEFAKLKEEAGKKLAKPIRIGRVDTGVTGIQKGSAEAVELAWRLRSGRKQVAEADSEKKRIDKELADREAAKEHFGAMYAADEKRKAAEAESIAAADKVVAERDKGLAAQGIDQAGIDALNESSWEGASTAPEIAVAREQQRKAREEAQRQAAAQSAEEGRRAAEQAAVERQYAAGFADLAQRDATAMAATGQRAAIDQRPPMIHQAGVNALAESAWEGASTAPEIAVAREQQRKAREEAQRQAAAQSAEQARRAAEQAAIQRQYAEGFSDLAQRDTDQRIRIPVEPDVQQQYDIGRGLRSEQPTDAIGNVLRDTITQQNAQQSEEAKDGPKTVGTLSEIRDILRNGQASQITVQEVSSI